MIERMPTIFFGHGNPMNALLDNSYSRAWSAIGAAIPRPSAILSISAHWFVDSSAVTAMVAPRTIHDFGGFPRELFECQYQAPGDPDLAKRVQQVLAPLQVASDSSWGLDHGTWSVLCHVFPKADVPVIQLSIDETQPASFHYDTAKRLSSLRDQGVLIIGSGNIVHNLRRIDWGQPDGASDWNRRFDDGATALLTERPGDILELTEHDDFHLAVPTPDHFIPMLYIAGLAAAADDTLDVFVEGPTFGSISMTSYALGADCPPSTSSAPAQTTRSSAAPPEQTNL